MVSRPGRNSFFEVSLPGRKNLYDFFGEMHFRDLNIMLGFVDKKEYLDEYQAKLVYFLHISLWYLKKARKMP